MGKKMAYDINEKINFRSRCTEKTLMHIDKIKAKYNEHNSNDIRTPKDLVYRDYDWTKTRDLLRLPYGEFKITDKIYEYDCEKGKYDDGSDYIRMVYPAYMFAGSIFISFYEDDYFEKRDWREAKVKRINVSVGYAGIRVSTTEYYGISDMLILPRGSFKEYASREIN